MSDHQSHGQPRDGGACVKIVGIGSGGSNVIDRMVDSISGVELITVNTDEQALSRSAAPTRIRIGARLTKGLSAGGHTPKTQAQPTNHNGHTRGHKTGRKLHASSLQQKGVFETLPTWSLR